MPLTVGWKSKDVGRASPLLFGEPSRFAEERRVRGADGAGVVGEEAQGKWGSTLCSWSTGQAEI